jgi:hypothetical protein
MPTLPSIAQGQMALDPVNQIIYYKNESDELKAVTLKWLQDSLTDIDTTDNVVVGGNFTITGNLTVNGTTTTLNTESILVEDNFLVLNSNITGTPSTNAGLEIERGDSANVVIRWNEGSDRWEFTDTDPISGPWYPLTKSTDDLTEGSTNKYFTDERAQDAVNAALVGGTGVSKSYNDSLDTITISIGQPVGTTDNVTFNQVTADLIGDVTGTVSDISNHGISDLSDVAINDAANGDFLRYNGSNWINDPVNLTTDTVGDYVATVTSGTGISVTNTGGEGATPNVAIDAVLNNLNDVVITGSATPGQTLQFDGTNWVNTVSPTMEPIGFENKEDSIISFNKTTREFSISPASTSYSVWCVGKKFTKTSTETIQIPNDSALHFIFFDSEGRLGTRQSYFEWDSEAPVSYIYWNADDQEAYFFADERHGIVLDWATHEYLHRTRGAAIANGFGINNYDLTGDANIGNSDTYAQIDIANGTFFDEDLQVDITHSNTPAPNTWEQKLQGIAEIPVFYRVGNVWKKDTATQFPLKQGTARAQYNLDTAGVWSTQDIVSGRFGISWIIATNNLDEPIIAVLGQGDYPANGAAHEAFYESLNLDGFPIVEFRPLYKIIYKVSDTYTNSVKTVFTDITDLRSIIAGGGVPSTAVSDHGSMTGLADDDHPQYLNESRHNDLDHSIALGTASLNDLGDVNIATPSSGQGLVWDGSVWLNTTIPLSLNGLTDVIITSATPNQVLKWNGTNWVNDESPSSISGTTFSETIGDGVQSQFALMHNLSTRNVVVSITEENFPYGAISSYWEATDLNYITIYFASPPDPASVRVNIYAAVTGSQAISYATTIGDNSSTSYVITHNLGTRDIILQARNIDSPYESYNVAWEATTINTATVYFDSAPAVDSVRIKVIS